MTHEWKFYPHFMSIITSTYTSTGTAYSSGVSSDSLSFWWKYYSDNCVVRSQQVYDVERYDTEHVFTWRWHTYKLSTWRTYHSGATHFCTLHNYQRTLNWNCCSFSEYLVSAMKCFHSEQYSKYIPYYCTHPGSSVLRRLW